jgi:phosphatidylglycerophosphate synthase
MKLDGVVDRYLNRKVSPLLTRLFLRLGFSANAITVLSLIVGLMAAAVFTLGSYAAGILGGLLLQLSAIIDCCDGEVARLTRTESEFGEQLDLVADNIVHVAIFSAVAWAVSLREAALSPLLLGAAAVVGNVVSFWVFNRIKAVQMRRAWTDPTQAARAELMLGFVSRDFSLLLLFMAVLDHLDWFLWMAAVGANLFWIAMAWITRSPTTARA